MRREFDDMKPAYFSPIRWMTEHRVAPNLLMLLFIIGGLLVSLSIKKEYLPPAFLDVVEIEVSYPGASPAEIEQGVVLPIENHLRSVDSIKEVRATIKAGSTVLQAELHRSVNKDQVFQQIQQKTLAIDSFPQGMEQPRFSFSSRIVDVIELVVHGNLDRYAIKRLAEKIRDKLLASPEIGYIELQGLPGEEIHIDIPQALLQRYDLRLEDVATQVRVNALEQSAANVRTSSGKILVSVNERRHWAREFARLPVIGDQGGDRLLLGEIAQISESFAETQQILTFDGEPGVALKIFRVEDQTPVSVAQAVYANWDDLTALLPPGTHLTVTDDDAKTYQQRMTLMLKNAFLGLLLVMLLLSLFLEYRLAFWVVLGIPVSVLGAILFLPLFDVSINIVSLFGFIIALGIVVDDAIIAGESIYEQMEKGLPFQEAAIIGAREVSIPLTFAILTNIAAFLPLLFLPGMMGIMIGVTPIVVICCFVISWVEALFILPSHLAYMKSRETHPQQCKAARLQQACNAALQRFVVNRFQPCLDRCLNHPWLTLSVSISVLLMVLAYAASGRLGFGLWPRLDGEWAVATVRLSPATPVSEAKRIREQLQSSAREVVAHNGGKQLLVSIRSEITGEQVEVALLLTASEIRPITSHELVQQWRNLIGHQFPGKQLSFDAERGGHPQKGAALTLELGHSDSEVLSLAGEEIANHLRTIDEVKEVTNSLAYRQADWEIKLNERGRSLGLSAEDVARQVRHALYGAQALRQQRNNNEVTVLVRLAGQDRQFARDIEQLMIKTATHSYVPLYTIAVINKKQSPPQLMRKQGLRILQLNAEVTPSKMVRPIMRDLDQSLLPDLLHRYPGLRISYEGRQGAANESMSSLKTGALLTVLCIFLLLAIPLKSYSQPLIVLALLPFGVGGSILGHILLGYELSMVSIQGMLALCGVVVNDGLILIDYANRQRRLGLNAQQAVCQAAIRRFKPIVLTSLTTFCGLAPMLLETSRQARFLAPMAVSLGVGILFGTIVCLLVLPTLYVLISRRSETVAHSNKEYAGKATSSL